MKHLVLIAALFSSSLWAAEAPLTIDLIKSYSTAIERIDALEDQYPRVFSELDQIAMQDQGKLVSFVRSSAAFPAIEKVLSESGFASFDQFNNVAMRIMGSLTSLQMPPGMTMEAQRREMEANIRALKKDGVDPSMIRHMEESLRESKELEFLMTRSSEADKAFVRNNMMLVMSVMPVEDDEEGEDSYGDDAGPYYPGGYE